MRTTKKLLVTALFVFVTSTILHAALLEIEPRPGMKLTVQMSSVSELTFIPPSKILYKRDYSLIPLQISVTVDASNLSQPCETGYLYDGASVSMELHSNIIEKFYSDGSFDHKLVGRCYSGWFSNKDGRVRLNKALGDYYLIQLLTMDYCKPEEGGSTSISNNQKVFTVQPYPDMSLYGFVREGVNGRDPESDEMNFWDPPVEDDNNDNDKDWDFNNKKRNKARCETYGRPAYGVNMRALVPGIIDKEFEMTTAGTVLDLTRYHAPGFSGIFGRDWRSSVEYSAIISYAYQKVPSDITILPGRGKNHSFTYNSNDSVFHPVEFKDDSLYISQGKIIWEDGESNLIHYFSLNDSLERTKIDSLGDKYGNRLRFKYNQSGQLISISDNAGRKLQFVWSGNHVNGIITPDGRKTSYTYNADGKLENTYDLEGLHTSFTYDELNNLTSFTFEGQKTTFEYDTLFNRSFLKSIIDPSGATTSYYARMYPNYSMTNVIEPSGNKVVYTFNDRFNISEIKYGNKNNFYTYSPEGQLIKNILPDGSEISYTYDDKQRLASASHIYNSDFQLSATEKFTYDSVGHLIRRTDPLNFVNQFRYNAIGQLSCYYSPAGDSVNFYYNQSGRLSRMKKDNGNYIDYSYDSFGNLIQLADNMGVMMTAVYDPTGQFLMNITDVSGSKSEFTYDNNKRLTGISYPDLTNRFYQYGCCSLEALTASNGMKTLFDRNGLNQLTGITFPDQYQVRMKYDENHRLQEVTGDDGNTHTIAYNNEGLPLNITKPDGNTVTFGYEDNNQVSSVTDEAGNITSYSYMNGKMSSVSDAESNVTYYKYDAGDNKSAIINARGNYLSYEYDFRGNLTSQEFQNKKYTYSYDQSSLLTKESGPHGSMQIAYDLRSNPLRIKWNQSDSIDLTYNNKNKLSQITYPDLGKVNYAYDQYNRLEEIIFGRDTVHLVYHQNGNINYIKRSNGWTSAQIFDQNGRIFRLSHLAGKDTVINLTTAYLPNGMIAAENIDAAFVSAIKIPTHTESATYNSLNQIITKNSKTYIYDTDGNLTGISDKLNASYSANNQLLNIQFDTLSFSYTYNGLNQVVKEQKNGKSTNLYYDYAGKLMFEKDQKGQLLRKYIYAGDYLLAMIENDTAYFYLFDKMGNTIGLTDGNGQLVCTYWYDPFGNKLLENESVTNRFTFLGNYQVSDEKNGFYRMGERYYGSVDGRFLQRDPKGMTDGTNLYVYAMNNPANYKDPSGKDVANGTADLFSCEGPEYLDSDSYDDETAEWLGDVVDNGTDAAPIVGDAKSGIKMLYYLYNKKYKDAAWELANIAGGKYLGGKAKGKVVEMFGEKSAQEAAKNIAETAANAVTNWATDAAKKATNNYTPPARPRSPDNPQVPYYGSRPGRINY